MSCSISESWSLLRGSSSASSVASGSLSSSSGSNLAMGEGRGEREDPLAEGVASETEPDRRARASSPSSSLTRDSRALMWFTRDSKCCWVRAFFAVSNSAGIGICRLSKRLVHQKPDLFADRISCSSSVDVWTIDLCKDMVVVCDGISSHFCPECSEDHTLEFELDE